MQLEINVLIGNALNELGLEQVEFSVEHPAEIEHGDYAVNVAFSLAKKVGKNPMEIADLIAVNIKEKVQILGIEKVEAMKPGFINFYLSQKALISNVQNIIENPERAGTTEKMMGKEIMVEFAHPNTHKEMHIGHMRTLITGEALSRLLESQGAHVFRANYQGDIGPHVAKAIYGIEKMIEEKGLGLSQVEKWSNKNKAHFLGEGYVRGNKDYDVAKEVIDDINNKLYRKVPGHYWDVYHQTHKWSMDYYDEFYTRFYTKFDRLFLESEMYEKGKEIVEANVGKIFIKENDGSIIFPGEKYGLHTRVFITQAGNPTYEGKEIQNALAEWEAFHFDKKIHVVASEQAGYFQVVFKALELLDPEKFVGKQYHLSMGMVQLVGKKMSSRTGEILTVDWLIDQIKAAAEQLFKEDTLIGEEHDEILEKVSIGAVKYSVLKSGAKQNTIFDIEKSVSLEGNSGPYLQYTYTRTQSVLHKSGIKSLVASTQYINSNPDESLILRRLFHFSEFVEIAATTYSPNIVCEYLFELAQLFNNFYQKYRIINATTEEEKMFRLTLTTAIGIVLQQGLALLGIQTPERM